MSSQVQTDRGFYDSPWASFHFHYRVSRHIFSVQSSCGRSGWGVWSGYRGPRVCLRRIWNFCVLIHGWAFYLCIGCVDQGTSIASHIALLSLNYIGPWWLGFFYNFSVAILVANPDEITWLESGLFLSSVSVIKVSLLCWSVGILFVTDDVQIDILHPRF